MALLDENKNSLIVVKDTYHDKHHMIHMPKIIKGEKHTNGHTNQRPEFYLKLVLLGDAAVGKSSLAKCYRTRMCICEETMKGVRMGSNEYMDSITECSGKTVFIRLYDTAGQEKYRSLTASYYRGAHGCLILYDVTKQTSFDNISYWLHDLREYTSQPEISTILVGTKCHVPEEEREVTYERAQKYAESLGLPYMEVSAEEGVNVTEVFEKLADLIIESLLKNPTVTNVRQPSKVVLQPEKKKKKMCSC